jgi:hypothetical protein
VSIENVLRQAFSPRTQFKTNPHIDNRFADESAKFVTLRVKHRATGHYECIVKCDYKDDVLEARLLQAQNQSGEYATRSVYISLQSAIDKMHDVIFLEMVQGE